MPVKLSHWRGLQALDAMFHVHVFRLKMKEPAVYEGVRISLHVMSQSLHTYTHFSYPVLLCAVFQCRPTQYQWAASWNVDPIKINPVTSTWVQCTGYVIIAVQSWSIFLVLKLFWALWCRLKSNLVSNIAELSDYWDSAVPKRKGVCLHCRRVNRDRLHYLSFNKHTSCIVCSINTATQNKHQN